MSRSALFVASLALAGSVALPIAAKANLLVNGDFESSTSETMTPPGWTNVGHMDGVIAYSVFSTPPYNGSYFYDLGGYGDPFGPVGDGIEQSVATTVGATYTLMFGLTSENGAGESALTVTIGSGTPVVYDLFVDSMYGELAKPFVTETLTYVATSASTLISFIETLNTSGGNNDPMIDGVSFDTSSVPVPEPASLALLTAALAGIGLIRRRR